jgi:hypothetical protein
LNFLARLRPLDVAVISAAPRSLRDGLGHFDSLDRQIFVRSVVVSAGGVPCGAIREPIPTRRAHSGCTAVALARHFDEPQRSKSAQRWRDNVGMQTETLEVCVRDRQFAIISAAVVRIFDLNPIKRPPLGERQNAHGGAFEHLDRTRRELARDPVPALGRPHFGAKALIAYGARSPFVVAQRALPRAAEGVNVAVEPPPKPLKSRSLPVSRGGGLPLFWSMAHAAFSAAASASNLATYFLREA